MKQLTRILLLLLLSIFYFGSDAQAASGGRTPRNLGFDSRVVEIYKQYSWENVFFDPEHSTLLVSLHMSSLTNLRSIFVEDLALAIRKDYECAKAEKGVCRIESELLFDSQDPDAHDLFVRKVGSDAVQVCFKEQEKKERCFKILGVKNQAGAWLIYDIIYDRPETLREFLKLVK